VQRFFDIILSGLALILLLPFALIVCGACYLDTRSPFFLQVRVGREQRPFTLFKFRTMYPETPSKASHLIDAALITRFGKLLRRTKLDELPQLWNVFIGDMSLVGPRPCLFNQRELIQERADFGIFSVRPGITGTSQIKGIDMSTPKLLAQTDAYMLKSLDTALYFKLIFLTAFGKGLGDRVGTP